MNAESIDPTDKKNLQIDISKFEYTDGKIIKELDDYAIYVDSPAMIVLSKLRALCQQTDQYANIIGRRYKKPRARDFFDIYTTVNEFNINLCTNENLEVLYGIFACKNVSLDLLDEIKSLRDFHKEDFASVRGTILPNIEVRDFEFYFDFVLALIEKLKASGIK